MAKAKRTATPASQAAAAATEAARREIVGGREHPIPWRLSESALSTGICTILDANGNTVIQNVRGQLAADRIVAAVNWFRDDAGVALPVDTIDRKLSRTSLLYVLRMAFVEVAKVPGPPTGGLSYTTHNLRSALATQLTLLGSSTQAVAAMHEHDVRSNGVVAVPIAPPADDDDEQDTPVPPPLPAPSQTPRPSIGLIDGWYAGNGDGRKCHYWQAAPAKNNPIRMETICIGAAWGGTGEPLRAEEMIPDAYRCTECARKRKQEPSDDLPAPAPLIPTLDLNDPRVKHWVMNGFRIAEEAPHTGLATDWLRAEHPMTGPITAHDLDTLDARITEVLEGYDFEGMLTSFCRSRGWVLETFTGKVVATHAEYGTLTAATRLSAYGGILTATKLGHVPQNVPPPAEPFDARTALVHFRAAYDAELLTLSAAGWDVVGAPRLKGGAMRITFRHGGTDEQNELAEGEVAAWADDIKRLKAHADAQPKPTNTDKKIDLPTTDLRLLSQARAAYSGGGSSFLEYARVKTFAHDNRTWSCFGDGGPKGGIRCVELVPKSAFPHFSQPKRKHAGADYGVEVTSRGNTYVITDREMTLRWDYTKGALTIPAGLWRRQPSVTAVHYWLADRGHLESLCGKKVKKPLKDDYLGHGECEICAAFIGKP